MTEIPHICDLIVSRLSALGSPISTLLQPGLSNKQICQAVDSLQFKLPDALMAMYQWRNGTKIAIGATFFPWWTFDTIGESLNRYEVLCAPGDDLWNHHLFPIFSANDVSSIGIMCSEHQSADGVIYCFESTLGTEVNYDNLESMLSTILLAYQTDVIFMNSDGNLDYDEQRYAAIAKQHNRVSNRWDA